MYVIKYWYFGILKNVIGIDSIPYSTTNTGIPPNPMCVCILKIPALAVHYQAYYT